MMRIMGLDYGTKTVGVAVRDYGTGSGDGYEEGREQASEDTGKD